MIRCSECPLVRLSHHRMRRRSRPITRMSTTPTGSRPRRASPSLFCSSPASVRDAALRGHGYETPQPDRVGDSYRAAFRVGSSGGRCTTIRASPLGPGRSGARHRLRQRPFPRSDPAARLGRRRGRHECRCGTAARASFGITVHVGPVEEAPIEEGSLDFVHMSHVLEHLDQPVTTLRRVARRRRPGGRLYVETPNVESLGFRWAGHYWFALDRRAISGRSAQ